VSDLTDIGSLMGIDIDTNEFKARFSSHQWVFQRSGERFSTVVWLLNPRKFSSVGSLRSDNLPIFLYTQPGVPDRQTSKRLTVQALSLHFNISFSVLHELVVFRGIPDSCHVAAALLPGFLDKAYSVSFSIIPIYSTLGAVRFKKNVRQAFIDELYMCFYIKDQSFLSQYRALFSSSPTPLDISFGCWSGQVADTFNVYKHSLTNIPSLRKNPLVLSIAGMTGDLNKNLNKVARYFLTGKPSSYYPAGVGYIWGNIDSPNWHDPKDFLLLFSPFEGGANDFQDA
jgi:hypothetical protein